jgi:hypothetical protein
MEIRLQEMCELLVGVGSITPFPTPPGASWSNVQIQFLNEHEVQIKVLAAAENRSFHKMGFLNKKSEAPNLAWEFLQKLAESKGFIPSSSSKSSKTKKKILPSEELSSEMISRNPGKRDAQQKRAEEIREIFQVLFQIDGDPFEPFRQKQGYQARFKIEYRD